MLGKGRPPRTYEATAQLSPFYVAEPEKFTLLLDHAVTVGRICEQQSQNVMSHSYGRSTSSSFYACSTQSSDSAQPGRLYSVQQDQYQHHFLHNNSYMDAIGEKLVMSAPCFIGANQTDGSQDFFPLETLWKQLGWSWMPAILANSLKEETQDPSLRWKTMDSIRIVDSPFENLAQLCSST